ncbi:MAG: endonuclease G, mitochondrial [Phormidesmis priestleyi Ana]|uniref:Endonuclease G, mitochondrial n=1 Tax=Phormidesmis priestleyi Ana TaxID=1666911 RepID=A0A0P7ZX42_9CYAN|nr:MAG: endonuclease G, mitochondrial [Phormidesmis priestleyi Ana]
MNGYDPDFLGKDIPLPMPSFSPALIGNVLNRLELRDGIYADYVNYTLVMNQVRRSPIFAALNIDQTMLKSSARKRGWDLDTRIGAEFQLNNDYYAANPWDRGHLARRSTISWGATAREAKKASDMTFFFSNATLQHENFNQDEWLALENWVKNLTLGEDGKITEFTGPIYGEFGRMISPSGRPPAETPAAFFKVVCFVSKETKELDVRAFILFQDREALADKNGNRLFNFQRYQVTVSEIEILTGLDFDDKIYEKNPLLFNENEEKQKRLNIPEFPERIEVDVPEEMISEEEVRDFSVDREVPIFIAAAMVNATGNDRVGEWISIINLSNREVDLTGWTLSDMRRPRLNLSKALTQDKRLLLPGQAVRVQPVAPMMLSNNSGVIALYDPPSEQFNKGRRIDRVSYTQAQASRKGVPIVFNSRQEGRLDPN